MKLKSLLALTLTLALVGLAACSNAGAELTVPTTSSTVGTPAGNSGPVEINYFYEADACFCLGLATEWVNTTMNTDYKAQQDAGKLVYKSWNSQDPANAGVVKQFNAPLVSFFITTVKDGAPSTHEVKGLWLYTDSSGKNEVLKSKFIGLLKSEVDKALAGN